MARARQHEHEPYKAVTQRHAWKPCGLYARHNAIEHCENCGVTRAFGGWYDRTGEWHTSSVPRCGEAVPFHG